MNTVHVPVNEELIVLTCYQLGCRQRGSQLAFLILLSRAGATPQQPAPAFLLLASHFLASQQPSMQFLEACWVAFQIDDAE